MHFARLRKKYLSIYIKCLQSNPNLVTCHENKEIQEIERDVDVDVAVQWRLIIIHAFQFTFVHNELLSNNCHNGGHGPFPIFLFYEVSLDL